MSQFSVLVAGDNIEAALAPFQVNTVGDCPAKYLEFFDFEGQLREQFETPNNKKKYQTFERFAKDRGHDGPDKETSRYGVWGNPNGKWDLWRIGGRWSGLLKLKAPRAANLTRRPSRSTEIFEWDDWDVFRVDSALKSEIDIEGIRKDAESAADAMFDKLVAVLKGRKFPVWAEIRDRYPKEEIDRARNAYHLEPVIKELLEHEELGNYISEGGHPSTSIFEMRRFLEYGRLPEAVDEIFCYGKRAIYVARARANAFNTHAVLLSGMWHERGKVEWLGLSSYEKDEEVWNAQFNTLIEDLPDYTRLTVVDCRSR